MIFPSNFENQHGSHPKTYKTEAVWKTALKGLALGLTYLKSQLRGNWSYQLKVREAHLLILKACNLTHTSRSLMMEYSPRVKTGKHRLHGLPLLYSSFAVFQSTIISQRGAFTHIWCPNFCSCYLGNTSWSPGLEARGACILGPIGLK